MKDIIPISVTIVIIGSIYATIKFTIIDIKNERFGRICNHQPPCYLFANTSNTESQQTSIVASPDYKTKSWSPNAVHEDIELVERPRSSSLRDSFSNRKKPLENSTLQRMSLKASIENPSDFNIQADLSNCTYNNIIIARTTSLKPR